MSETKPGSVLWRATTSRHDWRDGEPLKRLLRAANRLGLLGAPAEARELRGRARGLVGVAPEDLTAALLAARPDRSGVVDVLVHGNEPAPWELAWNVYPLDAASGWVSGLSSLWFRFDRSRIPDRAASDALLASFFEVERAEDTEYAVLHPYEHWSDFADPRYDEAPITNGLQFKGAFWSNFLGPGHLDEFDLAKLRDLEAHAVKWIDHRGLFVIASPDLDTADAPAGEPELLRLTALFRDALRPDSRWR